jgi:hypothetical protein
MDMNAPISENSPPNSRMIGSPSETIKWFKAVAVGVIALAMLLTPRQKVFATNLPPFLQTNAVSAQTTLPAMAPIITNVVVVPPTLSSLGAKDFFPFVTTLLGTFLGAYLAYGLALKKEQREEAIRIERKREETEEDHFSAILQTQFSLLDKKSQIQSVQRNILEPHRQNPKRHLHLALIVAENAEIPIPFDSLSFLLNKADLDTLSSIRIANNAFLNWRFLVKEHEALRRKLAEKYPPKNVDLKTGEADFADMVPHDELHLQKVVNYLYEQAADVVALFDKPYNQLSEYVSKNMKGRETLKMRPMNPSAIQS